jgi:hypothetical protein
MFWPLGAILRSMTVKEVSFSFLDLKIWFTIISYTVFIEYLLKVFAVKV